MSEFMIALLDLCLIPFSETSNLIVFVPTACLTISFLFSIVVRLMHGGRIQ